MSKLNMKRKSGEEKMVYDCFPFFNELDLLEIRLRYLDGVVDKFVITECVITQSGEPKPLYFKDNEERFSKWKDKIIHNVVDNIPDNFTERKQNESKNKILDMMSMYNHYPHNVWRYENETYQKECIMLALEHCNDNDTILFSDVDEIPNKEIIENLKDVDIPSNTHINLQQTMCQYYINVKKEEEWFGTRIFNYSYIKNYDQGLNGLRVSRNKRGYTINESGWHFTFLGGYEKIKEKIKAYGHQEFNVPYVLNNIKENVHNNKDIFYRPNQKYVDISLDNFPTDLIKIIKDYPIFIKGV